MYIGALLMFAKYGVGAQRAAPAPARHSLCPKTTLYSAGINKCHSWRGARRCFAVDRRVGRRLRALCPSLRRPLRRTGPRKAFWRELHRLQGFHQQMAAQAALTAGSNISRDAGKAVKALIWEHMGRQSSCSGWRSTSNKFPSPGTVRLILSTAIEGGRVNLSRDSRAARRRNRFASSGAQKK